MNKITAGVFPKMAENFIAFLSITQMNFLRRDKIRWQGMANATLSLISMTKKLGYAVGNS